MTPNPRTPISKHNRERRMLWKLGLHKNNLGRKATHDEIRAARAAFTPNRRTR